MAFEIVTAVAIILAILVVCGLFMTVAVEGATRARADGRILLGQLGAAVAGCLLAALAWGVFALLAAGLP